MKLTIAAVGRLRTGPEAALVSDYIARATNTGRAHALGPVTLAEIDDRKARDRTAQGARLLDSVARGATIICLDERGSLWSSPKLAKTLARLRDDGATEAAFLIGGADGHAPDVHSKADLTLSFGPMVWPHMLARVMLAEQIYRAVSIVAGSPYHRA